MKACLNLRGVFGRIVSNIKTMNNELAKQDLKQMREEIIQVVTTVRCDPRKGFISKDFPFGKEILGKKWGTR